MQPPTSTPPPAAEPPNAGPPPGRVTLPQHWPSAWSAAGSALWPLVINRAVFAGATCLLTGVGLWRLGDPGAQWWVIALPLLLLIGPLLRVGRTPAVIGREVRAGRAEITAFDLDSLLVRAGHRRSATVAADGTVHYLRRIR
jgi:hypothetical protein